MVSPTDVTLSLFVDAGSGFAAAGETVTWAPVSGQTGYYDISYAPSGSGLYKLLLQEINASSMGRRWQFTQEVVAAGATFLPSFANAFCSESDVERWLQQSIDVTTSPTDTQTAAFAESRAAVLMTLCASLGYPVTPSTVTAGSRLESLLREANAIGTALDYTAAQILSLQPSKSDRFDYFRQLWLDYYGGVPVGFVTPVPGVIEKEIKANLVSLGTDHILSGDTLPSNDSGTVTDGGPSQGGSVGMGAVY